MQIPHGCLEGLVTHGLLDGPRVGAPLQGIEGIGHRLADASQFRAENSGFEYTNRRTYIQVRKG